MEIEWVLNFVIIFMIWDREVDNEIINLNFGHFKRQYGTLFPFVVKKIKNKKTFNN